MNKILVKIYFPVLEEKYDIWIPSNKKIYSVIKLLSQTVEGLISTNDYSKNYNLYNRYSGICYDLNKKIQDTNIGNGTELIFL